MTLDMGRRHSIRTSETAWLLTILVVGWMSAACSGTGSATAPSEVAQYSTAAVGANAAMLATDTDAATLAAGAGAATLAGVRQATAAFHDVGAAIAAGYVSPVGGRCDQIAAGAMGVHSPNPGLIQNPGLIPEQPEVLAYLPTGDGNYRLVAVEYFQSLLLRNTQTGQVGPWISPDPWPAHYVVVNSTPSLFGQSFQGPMPGHVPGMPWHYDLHVWLWSPNPSGMFAQWNPALSCG